MVIIRVKSAIMISMNVAAVIIQKNVLIIMFEYLTKFLGGGDVLFLQKYLTNYNCFYVGLDIACVLVIKNSLVRKSERAHPPALQQGTFTKY